MPKTAEEIAESKRKRIEIANKYGGVPTSIWEIDYSIGKDINELHSKKQHVVSVDRHKKMDYDKRLYKHVAMSVQMVRGKGAGISTFPPELVKRVESFYSEPGDTVLDLSAGHNSRMECTYQLGRNYIGYDPSIPFMAFNREVAEKLLNNKLLANGCTITLRQQSSEHLEEADNSVDLVFTSPPYYKIETYGDEPEQLGKNCTYDEFLDRMTTVLREGHRVLKPGKFMIINVNDFMYEKEFYPYHADIINIYRRVGIPIHDIIIVKWKNSISQCFATKLEKWRRVAKLHEYLIVGRKNVV